MKYKVKEIFKSIQGEGYHVGKSAIFVRFSGCNLWNGNKLKRKSSMCDFCDTDFIGTGGVNGGNYNLDDLINKINQIWESTFTLQNRFVILTGGEPLLQVDKALVNKLKQLNYFVAIETNGTINTDIDFDWLCVSPKEKATLNLKKGDELKVVYPQDNYDLKSLEKLNFNFFFSSAKV